MSRCTALGPPVAAHTPISPENSANPTAAKADFLMAGLHELRMVDTGGLDGQQTIDALTRIARHTPLPQPTQQHRARLLTHRTSSRPVPAPASQASLLFRE
ncbi:hypothetical protein [Nocardia donostiensis]|uniref:hypothetical protein n=1 Tax=Nocardia donostiensis TaxID=1538463 RepID=UPI0009DA99EB